MSADLDWLLEKGRIQLRRSTLFDSVPPEPDRSGLAGRVEGMLLGLAIGDSLGNTTESMTPAERRSLHGEVRDYLPSKWAGGRAVGVPSDDTQLSFWALEHLLENDGRLDPASLAQVFGRRDFYGAGKAVSEFRLRLGFGVQWWDAAAESAGNGALMRAAPFLLPHLATPSPQLWADAAVGARITHNDEAAIVASIGFTHLLWGCLAEPEPRDDEWWIAEFLRIAEPLQDRAMYRSRVPGDDFHGRLTDYALRARTALSSGATVLGAGNSWYSGAYVLETVASVLFILARHGAHPEEAIVRAVNDTRDNDTIASIVGAVVGALHGVDALPPRWIRGLTGRTMANDDGRIQDLTRRAVERFASSGP